VCGFVIVVALLFGASLACFASFTFSFAFLVANVIIQVTTEGRTRVLSLLPRNTSTISSSSSSSSTALSSSHHPPHHLPRSVFSWSVVLNVTGAGLSLITKKRTELCYLTFAPVLFSVLSMPHQNKFTVWLLFCLFVLFSRLACFSLLAFSSLIFLSLLLSSSSFFLSFVLVEFQCGTHSTR
jgi:hypothetical protein